MSKTVAFRVCSLAMALLVATATQALAAARSPEFKSQNAVEERADPENQNNDVLRVITTASFPSGSASVSRNLTSKDITISDLRNMLSVKYFFEGRTCAGGSPRFQIRIDETGDGLDATDSNAFGYLGNQAFGGGCPPGEWVYEDMTNSAPKWDLSQLGGAMTMTWDQVEVFLNTVYPNHKIIGCKFVDDSGSFAPTTIGIAYYDNIQCYDRILEDHLDVSRGSPGF
jgi:hypothetical protein